MARTFGARSKRAAGGRYHRCDLRHARSVGREGLSPRARRVAIGRAKRPGETFFQVTAQERRRSRRRARCRRGCGLESGSERREKHEHASAAAGSRHPLACVAGGRPGRGHRRPRRGVSPDDCRHGGTPPGCVVVLAAGAVVGPARRCVFAGAPRLAQDRQPNRARSPASGRSLPATSLCASLVRRQPGFVVLTVLTHALGIAVTTAVATIAYAVLLRPLPYADPDRLFHVYEVDRSRQDQPGAMSWQDFLEFARGAEPLQASPVSQEAAGR